MADRRLPWLDPLLAAVLTGIAVAITLSPDDTAGGTAVDTVLAPTVTLSLLWRRRAPLAAAAGLSAGIVLSGIPTFDQTRCGFALPAALLILWPLALDGERNEALAGLALVLAGTVFLLFTDPLLNLGAGFIPVLCAGVWGAGRVARSRRALAEDLAARSQELERIREHTAALAVEVERTQLAAYVEIATADRLRHVVGLAKGGQASQADRERSREAFASIEREGRRSLNEMRALLGVLRSDVRDTSPRPTLAQLEKLLETARAGGKVVEVEVEGDRRPLPSAVELAAYRMLQHSLEALSGPAGSGAAVQLRYLTDAIELEVLGSIADGNAAGAALAAARERVTAQGGSFSTEPGGGGRTRLLARLPAVAAGV